MSTFVTTTGATVLDAAAVIAGAMRGARNVRAVRAIAATVPGLSVAHTKVVKSRTGAFGIGATFLLGPVAIHANRIHTPATREIDAQDQVEVMVSAPGWNGYTTSDFGGDRRAIASEIDAALMQVAS